MEPAGDLDIGASRSRTPGRIGRFVLGALLLVAGLSAIGFVLYVSYGQSDFSRRMVTRLGLTFALLISAIGQIVAIAGVLTLYHAVRTGKDRA